MGGRGWGVGGVELDAGGGGGGRDEEVERSRD